jgi:hypothetical protein
MQELKTQKFKTLKDLDTFVREASKMLTDARPTEPMLFNGLKAALNEFVNLKFKIKNLKLQENLITQKIK